MKQDEVQHAYVGGDVVNHPKHYVASKAECIDIIENSMSDEQYKGFLRGNIIKYLFRYENKNGVEDLKKAQWYLARLIITEVEGGVK